MALTIERISILILEAVEQEWRREPSLLKCRPASEVLGPLKSKHGLEDADITRAITFMQSDSRQYLQIVKRPDGHAILPSDNGLTMLAKIEMSRIEEVEKKKWTRSDKIALAGFLFSIVTFFAGLFVGAQASKRPDVTPTSVKQSTALPSLLVTTNSTNH